VEQRNDRRGGEAGELLLVLRDEQERPRPAVEGLDARGYALLVVGVAELGEQSSELRRVCGPALADPHTPIPKNSKKRLTATFSHQKRSKNRSRPRATSSAPPTTRMTW